MYLQSERNNPMSNSESNFVRVADLKDVAEGTPKAVRTEGRSIALFHHQGNFYATDNQCPHMGYPLTRGRVRNGVLTCGWRNLIVPHFQQVPSSASQG
jgi:nitrite reductase/ring-hydroxylating ferredoxin subunit